MKKNVKEEKTLEKKVKLEENKEKTNDKKNSSKENTLKNKLYLSYGNRIAINIVVIMLFLMLSFILFVSSISVRTKTNMVYRQTSNLDYKVYLKQNEFYEKPYLEKNMKYVAALIDYVDVDFNYNFSASQLLNYKYTYYIKSDVKVTDSTDTSKVIFSSSDDITEAKTVDMTNSSNFNIKENIKVDYAKYNDIVKAFKSSYGISADSNLTLTLFIDIVDEKGNKIKDANSDAMKINIPLTEQMIDINMEYKEINNSNNVAVYKDFEFSNKISLGLSVLSLIAFIIAMVKLLNFLTKTSSRRTVYDTTLAKILREYDRVIVNSRKSIDLGGEIIEVKSFNELLDVRDNLEKPIIFSEIHRGQKSVFIVKNGNENYRYILKLVDLEKEKENAKEK